MNVTENDILLALFNDAYINQRALAESTGYSLGKINMALKALVSEGYLTDNMLLTSKAKQRFHCSKTKNAIILAAGSGMRMVPINMQVPKGLIEVHNEPLIERLIKQFKESGISDITIVVGFMKESFDYLIDEYGVQLIYNPQYSIKNNLCSLSLVADRISDTYIVPSDIWCSTNPFRSHELYSWYMVSDDEVQDSLVRVNRKKELVTVPAETAGNRMTEIVYIKEEDSEWVKSKIKKYSASRQYDKEFWEIVLFQKGRMMIPARVVKASDVIEIDTYEQLRDLDQNSDQLKSDALDVISEVFQVRQNQITDITVLKKGMTNRSFMFSVCHSKYIMRIPGEGTDQLINRAHEAAVYKAISGLGICDDPLYINPENGYKITRFLNGIRVADAYDTEDLEKCMERLRSFHEMNLQVDHTFDLFGQIEFYESLWDGRKSIYKDFELTKKQVFSLRSYIDSQDKAWALTHIDAVPDNFLFYTEDGIEYLQLTDWEYAGMQDPHLDLAMFSIYSGYSKEQVDQLIDLYFMGQCSRANRIKIYCYVAASGLLWSNWCEYKSILGVEFGEYAMKQYRYAKDFYQYAIKEMSNERGES